MEPLLEELLRRLGAEPGGEECLVLLVVLPLLLSRRSRVFRPEPEMRRLQNFIVSL